MADIETLLARWQSAGVLGETAARIRAHEAQASAGAPAGLRWQGVTALILRGILLACGVVLFVSAHWDELGPGARYALVIAMVAVFHVAGGLARSSFRSLSTALHAVGTVAAGAAIALVGQIFNIQDHWPAAVLLWALAALFGWALLRDQAQQTLALLLVPAWIFCELGFRINGHIGEGIYMGRLYFMWSILYIAFFIASRRKAVQGILFAVGVVGIVVGVVLMLSNWASWIRASRASFPSARAFGPGSPSPPSRSSSPPSTGTRASFPSPHPSPLHRAAVVLSHVDGEL